MTQRTYVRPLGEKWFISVEGKKGVESARMVPVVAQRVVVDGEPLIRLKDQIDDQEWLYSVSGIPLTELYETLLAETETYLGRPVVIALLTSLDDVQNKV